MSVHVCVCVYVCPYVCLLLCPPVCPSLKSLLSAYLLENVYCMYVGTPIHPSIHPSLTVSSISTSSLKLTLPTPSHLCYLHVNLFSPQSFKFLSTLPFLLQLLPNKYISFSFQNISFYFISHYLLFSLFIFYHSFSSLIFIILFVFISDLLYLFNCQGCIRWSVQCGQKQLGELSR